MQSSFSLFQNSAFVLILTVEEWSGLLCDSTRQHAVVQCQGRARCLCAPVFTLYIPERGAPAVGVWLKDIILLIVHTRALGEKQPLKWQNRERKVITSAEYRISVLQPLDKSKPPQVSFTNDCNLEHVRIRPDEMISDTFIICSFLHSIHHQYRQPVWFIMSALKSIKPQ